MTNTNESFIDEVTEAVRRERLNLWFRRWGWIIGVVVLAIVGGAAWVEWSRSQTEAEAELRGEAVLTALETEDDVARLAALSDLPRAGQEGVVTALLLAAEQQSAGEADAAIATLNTVAGVSTIPQVYRDLAALKALMAQGASADPLALQALAAPGAPYALLAQEQLALVHLANDRRDEAVTLLQGLRDDAGVGPTQRARVDALLTALGVPPEEADASLAEVPVPAGE
ncbi:tetratricopeptide repeat protein [Rubellimicrobium rubrum]|uniref:tetratricopeptide repeat protein n=1 Tax=Rubellimicrobium rubrum TaxID=2585369 RepID=UPI00159B9056|nr:tetratricopeptide repeat protein [Rubellimicrobium rubrum]